jgi:hypothetical protein
MDVPCATTQGVELFQPRVALLIFSSYFSAPDARVVVLLRVVLHVPRVLVEHTMPAHPSPSLSEPPLVSEVTQTVTPSFAQCCMFAKLRRQYNGRSTTRDSVQDLLAPVTCLFFAYAKEPGTRATHKKGPC